MRATPALAAAVGVPLLLAACGGVLDDGQTHPEGPHRSVTASSGPAASGPAGDARTREPATTARREQAPPAGASAARTVVLFTGDLMLARSVGERIATEGPEMPWDGIVQHLEAADLRVGVLETAVGTAGEAEDKGYTFQAPPEAVDSLLSGGIDVVTLANNHSYDFGPQGLLETMTLLDGAGIGHVGAGADSEEAHAALVVDSGGVGVAFLGYVSVPDDWTGYRNRDWAAGPGAPGVAWAEPEAIAADVAAAAGRADHVVVLLHAGDEGSRVVNQVQRAAAEAALGAGASAVVGAHPHVLQGHRFHDGQLVAWSLGNTVFDGFTDPDSLETALLSVTFTPEHIEEVRFIPAVIDGRGFPVAVDPQGEAGRAILERLRTLPVP